jgi:hypothetical protein
MLAPKLGSGRKVISTFGHSFGEQIATGMFPNRSVSFPPIADIRAAADNSTMDTPEIDPEIIRGFIQVRQDLLFWLSEQNGPPRELTEPLWQAFQLVAEGIQTIERVTGFVEENPPWPSQS